jgi:hypothetical protein
MVIFETLLYCGIMLNIYMREMKKKEETLMALKSTLRSRDNVNVKIIG